MAAQVTARELSQVFHCSGCGEKNPGTIEGYTGCCNKRGCHGTGLYGNGWCCGVVRDLDEAERSAPVMPIGTRVITPKGAKATVTTRPVLTASGWAVDVDFDEEFKHLSASGGAGFLVEELSNLRKTPAKARKVPAAVKAPAKGRREALGASSATGWALLYDKPKAGAEVGRRYVAGGKAEYALICKAHGHVHPLPRLADEGPARKAGGWCPSC